MVDPLPPIETREERKQRREQRRQKREIAKQRSAQIQYIALLACGVGQEAAARYLGTNPTSFTREQNANEQFRAEVQSARDYCEAGLFSVVWQAAQGGDVKACQWLLERGWWQRWCKRTPDQVTPEQLAAAMGRMVNSILSVVPPEHHEAVNEKVETILVGLTGLSGNDLIENTSEATSDQPPIDVDSRACDEAGDGATDEASRYKLF